MPTTPPFLGGGTNYFGAGAVGTKGAPLEAFLEGALCFDWIRPGSYGGRLRGQEARLVGGSPGGEAPMG